MLPFLTQLHAQLDAVNPLLWPLLIAVVAGGVIAGWRKLHLASFERVPRRIQALPAVLVAAALGGASGTDLTNIIVEAVSGSLSGLLAVGGYHGVTKPMKRRRAAAPPAAGSTPTDRPPD